MPRTARIVIDDEQTVYHVISRTALDGYPLGDVEKDFFVDLIRRLSGIYFTEVLGFCVMGNHFHLLVRMLPKSTIEDGEIRQRFERSYGKERHLTAGQIPMLRHKWCSISEFVKEIKQTFSRFYNKRHGRKGFLWGERFKSVIVENGDTLINCLAYIDLNPIRAGIVQRPEQYRWSSLGYHVQQNNKGSVLSLDFGLKEFGKMNKKERLRRYREYVYEAGALDTDKGGKIEAKIIDQEKKQNFELTRIDRFRYRSRYFTDSGIIGSKEYVQKNFQRFKALFQITTDRVPKRISGLEGMYSLKRLGGGR